MTGDPGRPGDEFAVEAIGISKAYRGQPAIRSLSLALRPGEKVAVIGPSGCGKTTLLRCLLGLEALDEGTIRLLGTTIAHEGRPRGGPDSAPLRGRVALVSQHNHLWPHRTVLENVIEAPARVKRLPRKQYVHRARELLDRVGLIEKEGAYPHSLSGGQQQRAAIARAFAVDPELVCLDETTSALDPELTSQLLELMKELFCKEQTVVLVTHEMGFAREAASRVLFMDHGLLVEDTPCRQFFDDPSSERAKTFLRRVLQIRR